MSVLIILSDNLLGGTEICGVNASAGKFESVENVSVCLYMLN